MFSFSVHKIVGLWFTFLNSGPLYLMPFYFNKLLLYKAAHLVVYLILSRTPRYSTSWETWESHSVFVLDSCPVEGTAIL